MSELNLIDEKLPAIDSLNTLETNELYSIFAKLVTVSAITLKYMSAIWKELESRGEDLSDLRSGLAEWMPLIAEGKLAAETVIKFSGKRMLLQRLALLSIEKQIEIIGNPDISIVKEDQSQGFIVKNVNISRLGALEILQIFDETHCKIRTQKEQFEFLKKNKSDKKTNKSTPTISLKGGYLKIGKSYVRANNKRISADNIVKILSDYYNVDILSIIKQRI